MVNLKTFATIILLCLFIIVQSQAQEKKPIVPYIQKGTCPFECCQYGEWIARSQLTVFQKEKVGSAIAFTIKRDEHFTAISGNVHIVKLGEVAIKKSYGVYVKGDKVYLLSYRGEGIYDTWHKGEVSLSDDALWENGEALSDPAIEWWVYVVNKDDKRGWLRLKNISESGFKLKEKIDGMDSCS